MKKIPLTQGKFALVDDDDFEYINQFKWCILKKKNTYYAVRSKMINGKLRAVLMHRDIMDVDSTGINIDHKDRNGLNNQRSNLRKATVSQNRMNSAARLGCSSKYKGVSWNKHSKSWSVKICKNGEKISIGYFKNEKDAADAYNKAAAKLHGEFAYFNIL